MNRWTVNARTLFFDGRPFVHLNKEGDTRPTEADGAARLIIDLFNREGVTPDGIFERHMGMKPRAREKAIPYDDDNDEQEQDDRDHREVTLYDDDAMRMIEGWWRSQGDPLYAIHSMGGRHEAWVFQDAIANLDSDISRVKKLGRNKYQLGKGTFTKKEIDELSYIRDALAGALIEAGAG